MRDINKSLKFWLDELSQFELTQYEKLPDIDLYMDQVITYLERVLQTLSLSTLDKQITSSMINNYVKGEVIPSPIAKRYNKEHIALILEVCMLKKALSISNIKDIIDINYKDKDFTQIYNNFANESKEIMHDIVNKTSEKLEKIEQNDHLALYNLALELSLNASTNMLIAERILDYIRIQKDLKDENNE